MYITYMLISFLTSTPYVTAAFLVDFERKEDCLHYIAVASDAQREHLACLPIAHQYKHETKLELNK